MVSGRFQKIIPILLGSSLLLTACGSISDTSPQIRVLTIGTADSSGNMYPAGKAIARIFSEKDPSLRVNIDASTGSPENVKHLTAHQVDLGLVSGEVAYSACYGKGIYEGAPVEKLRAIGSVYLCLSNWMVTDRQDIQYVHDLGGCSIANGPENSGTDVTGRLALSAAGIDDKDCTIHNISYGDGARLALEGTSIQAVHGFTGTPVFSLENMAEKKPSHLLEYTDEELATILSYSDYYSPGVIPAGTYKGQEKDVKTFGVPCLLCVNADMDAETVFQLTKLMDESASDLSRTYPFLRNLEDPSFLYSHVPIPFHDGALKYYQEKGYIQ